MVNKMHKNDRSLLKVLVLTLGTFSGTWLNASVGYSYDDYPYSENNYEQTWGGLTQDERDENFRYVPENGRAALFFTLSLQGMIRNLFRVPAEQLADVLKRLTSEQRDAIWAGLSQGDKDKCFQYFPSWELARRYQDLSEQAQEDNYFQLTEHEREWAWPKLGNQRSKNRNWFHAPKKDWERYWYGLDETGKGENFMYWPNVPADGEEFSKRTIHYFELSDEWKVKNFRYIPANEQQYVLGQVSPIVHVRILQQYEGRGGILGGYLGGYDGDTFAISSTPSTSEEDFMTDSSSESVWSSGEEEAIGDPSSEDGESVRAEDYFNSFTGTWQSKDNPYVPEYGKEPILRNLGLGEKSLFKKGNEATTGSNSAFLR